MEFGEMKRNTSNWSNFCMLLRCAGLTALAGLSCQFCSLWRFFVTRIVCVIFRCCRQYVMKLLLSWMMTNYLISQTSWKFSVC